MQYISNHAPISKHETTLFGILGVSLHDTVKMLFIF